MRNSLPLILLILSLLFSGCARQPEITPIVQPIGLGAPASRSSAYEEDECPEQGFGRQGGAQCGFLTVPVDRSLQDGSTIRLAVTILQNRTDDNAGTPAPAQPDPLLLLGVGGTRFGRGMASAIGDVLNGRDVILIDQRGSGRSEPVLDCPELNPALNQRLDGPMFSAARSDQLAAVLQTCRQRWTSAGITLQNYNSAAIAADLEDLRLALGYAQWNVYANGSDAHLAYLLMRDFPAGLRSVTIDGSPPEDPARLTDQAAIAQAALTGYFGLCEHDVTCNETYPDLEARFYRAVDDFNAAPQSVEVQNLNSGTRYNVFVDGDTLLNVTINSLNNWDQRVLPELPRVIAQVEKDDLTALKTVLGSQAALPFSSSGMNWLVNCTETVPLLSEQAISTGLSNVNVALGSYYRKRYETQRSACAAFDGVQPTTPRLEPIKGGAPTLAVVTSLSPGSSLAWAQSATSQLSTRWVIEFKSPVSGQAGGLDCARGLLRAFLTDPSTAPDAACANQPATLRWITFQP